MKSFFKFLSRNKLYTAIEVFGLAIALMFIIIIAKFAQTEFSIDSYHENADNIYTLATPEYIGTAYGVAGKMLERYPEIKYTCAVMHAFDKHVEVYDKAYDIEAIGVDSTFLKMFSYDLKEGDRNQALADKNNVIISESFANNAFNGLSPIGKSLNINWGDTTCTYIVTGVIKEIKNSIIKDYDLIFSMELVEKYINSYISSSNCSNAAGVSLFIQTYPGSDLVSKTDDMLSYFKEFFWVYSNGIYDKVILIPLKDIYFSNIMQASGWFNQGEKQFVFILTAVAFFILLFALINYINLTVAQTSFRAKEMAMRRLLGSSKWKVIMRFIVEAILLTCIAFAFSIIFTEAVKPYTQTLLGREVSLTQDITTLNIAFCIGLILLIGILAGIIPAMIISRYKPIDVVKGSFRLQSKMVMGKVFVTIQNVITITMLALTLALFLQFNHLMNKPLGYSTKDIMTVDIPSVYSGIYKDAKDLSPWTKLKDELEKLPDVKRVGLAKGDPLSSANNTSFVRDGENVSIMYLEFDTTAFNILNFNVVQQNQDAIGGRYWLTENAVKKLYLNNDVTEVVLNPEWDWNIDVCGIVKDYNRVSGLYEDSKNCNVIVMIHDTPWNLIVETNENHQAASKAIKAKMKELTTVDSKCNYFDDVLYMRYGSQRNTMNIVLIFTIITIIISTLGLIAMSTYYTRQRALEIGVRKVFGSTSMEMFTRLVGNFLKLLLISFVIAVPIAWYVIDYWLKDYSYRISISPLIFVAAGFVTLVIAAAAISWQSAKAANANPVDTVKKQQM